LRQAFIPKLLGGPDLPAGNDDAGPVGIAQGYGMNFAYIDASRGTIGMLFLGILAGIGECVSGTVPDDLSRFDGGVLGDP